MMQATEKNEQLYKILVIGDIGAGKTSIIKRYVHDTFTANYKSTIGVDFALKVIKVDENNTVKLQLWDIAGQERFGNMTRVYYKEAFGAFIVFDISSERSLDTVIKWKHDLDDKIELPTYPPQPLPVILLANKCDLISLDQYEHVERCRKLNDFCNKHGFISWREISAKTGMGINEAGMQLVNSLQKIRIEPETMIEDPTIILKALNPEKEEMVEVPSGCCLNT